MARVKWSNIKGKIKDKSCFLMWYSHHSLATESSKNQIKLEYQFWLCGETKKKSFGKVHRRMCDKLKPQARVDDTMVFDYYLLKRLHIWRGN